MNPGKLVSCVGHHIGHRDLVSEGEEGEKEAVFSAHLSRALSKDETGSARRFSAVYWTPN